MQTLHQVFRLVVEQHDKEGRRIGSVTLDVAGRSGAEALKRGMAAAKKKGWLLRSYPLELVSITRVANEVV